jgi:hypothetical protein
MLPAHCRAEPTVANGANPQDPAQDSQASDTGPLGSLRAAFSLPRYHRGFRTGATKTCRIP